MSVSSNDSNIRVWNVNGWECIFNFTNINKAGLLVSACFLKNNNQIYIVSSNFNANGNSE
jgi:WD40 repeat protein